MFDKKKIIKLAIKDKATYITMLPIKIKHLDLVNMLSQLDEDDVEDNEEILQICLKLIEETTDADLSKIPQTALNEFMQIFIDFNFQPNKFKKHKNNKNDQNEKILQCIDFLISEGHCYSDILDYSIFEFSKFVDLAVDRKGGYKKKDINPMKMLTDIGVKVDG